MTSVRAIVPIFGARDTCPDTSVRGDPYFRFATEAPLIQEAPTFAAQVSDEWVVDAFRTIIVRAHLTAQQLALI